MEHHIFALSVRPWLQTYFTVRWIGRWGPNEWPSQSPILTPCWFRFVGMSQVEVCWSKPRILDKLKQKIRDPFVKVPADFFRKRLGLQVAELC